MKNSLLIVMYIYLMACSSEQPLNKPLQFQNPSELFHSLAALEKELDSEDYLALTNAIGYLKVTNTDINSLDDFYSGFSGLTPNQIISKADDFKQNNKK